jgi:hypothetical protein
MKIYINLIFIVLALLGVLSCTPSPPYEVRSPCVSIDGSDHTYGITPCARRPINAKHTII